MLVGSYEAPWSERAGQREAAVTATKPRSSTSSLTPSQGYIAFLKNAGVVAVYPHFNTAVDLLLMLLEESYVSWVMDNGPPV